MSEAIEKNEEVKTEKPYTLRELCDEDLYAVVSILGAVIPDDMKEEFVRFFSEEKDKKRTLEQNGMVVAFDFGRMIMKNIKVVKTEVYDLLSDLSSIPANDIRKMPFGTTPAMLKEVFDNAKNVDFFKELSELLL